MIDRTHHQPHHWHKERRIPDHESPHPFCDGAQFRIYRFPNGLGVTATNLTGYANFDSRWWTVGIVEFHGPDIMDYHLPDKVTDYVSAAKLEVILDQVEARGKK